MFLNLLTTNPSEAGELLLNIYPAVIVVVLIYVPLLWIAARHIRRRIFLHNQLRLKMAVMGAATFLLGCLVLVAGCRPNVKHVVRDELFPVNVTYNMSIAISQMRRTANFPETSRRFKYMPRRDFVPKCREVYVLVIGEASRAASWQMYGYERETNPLLSQRGDVALFKNVITQSNATHKSVPMMLSSVHASQHRELYNRTGIAAMFNEAGFTTYFISNQSPQGAMIDNLAREAQHVEYVDAPNLDMQLVEIMQKLLSEEKSDKILFILHTYGSHFSYHQRYGREFARFLPDDDVAVTYRNADLLRNAYDNSILYTDYFLNEVISTLEGLDGISTAMLYCADHGEDLFDGKKKRFLHASPRVTYHQLHVASLAWFSPKYKELYASKVEAAFDNEMAPATTYSVFHTMADMADISSRYVVRQASLLEPYFDFGAVRYYLDDHNRAVKLDSEIGIDAEQRRFFAEHGIELR